MVDDRSQSYQARADAARRLAGETAPEVVRLLSECLVEPEIGQDEDHAHAILVRACAESLGWAAVRGRKAALEGLYRGLFAPATHAREGEAIMDVLLDVQGAREVLRAILAPLRGDAMPYLGRIEPPFSDNKNMACLVWFRHRAAACHYGPGVDPRQVLDLEFRRVSNWLRRATDARLEAVLGDPQAALMLEFGMYMGTMWNRQMYNEGSETDITRALVERLSRRSLGARTAVVKWLLTVDMPQSFHSLDSEGVRQVVENIRQLRDFCLCGRKMDPSPN